MAYVGQGIKGGTFSVLDTSGNTYNGSNVTFNLGTQVSSPAQLLVSHDGVIQKPVTDYVLATGGTQITFTTAPASGASIFITEISGAVGAPMNRDINGDELILDADGDTSITADTDDQIDIRIAGADDFQFSANAMNVLSGSTLTIDSGATITNSGTATGFNVALDDVSTGDAASTLATSAGNITVDAQGNDTDIIFKGTDGGADTTFLTIDGSAAGASAFNSFITSTAIYGKGDDNTGIQFEGSDLITIHTGGNERMRVNSSGYLQIGTTSGSAQLDVEVSAAIVGCLVTCTSGSYDANVINLVASRDTTNETYNILRGQNGAGFAIAIRDSGNVENVNNSYGSSSDERIKQNIVDANSQWDDIKALKIRNYKLKKEVAKGVDKTYLGVVAQEVETAGMNGLIGGSTAEDKETVALSSDFGTLYEDGDVLPEGKKVGDIKTLDQRVKSVKYSILYMKAIKALQEAQTRIETLETKVKTLEDA